MRLSLRRDVDVLLPEADSVEIGPTVSCKSDGSMDVLPSKPLSVVIVILRLSGSYGFVENVS